MAVPSRRNSGFETTKTSGRCSSCSTIFVEPTGTVDLFTTTAPGCNKPARLLAAAWTNDKSALPSTPCGVGTQRNTTSAELAASVRSVVNRKLPFLMPASTNAGRPSSMIGISPAKIAFIRATLMSTHQTSCPRCEKQAALESPT